MATASRWTRLITAALGFMVAVGVTSCAGVRVSTAEELGAALGAFNESASSVLVVDIEQGMMKLNNVAEEVEANSNSFGFVNLGINGALVINGAGIDRTILDLQSMGRFLSLIGESDNSSLHIRNMTIINGGFAPSVYELYLDRIKKCKPDSSGITPNLTICGGEAMSSLVGVSPTRDPELGADFPLGGVIYARGVKLHLESVSLSSCSAISGGGIYSSGLFSFDNVMYGLYVSDSQFKDMHTYLQGSSILTIAEDTLIPAVIDVVLSSTSFNNSATSLTGNSGPLGTTSNTDVPQAAAADWVQVLVETIKELNDDQVVGFSSYGAVAVESVSIYGDSLSLTVTNCTFDRCTTGEPDQELGYSQIGGGITLISLFEHQSNALSVTNSNFYNCSSRDYGGAVSMDIEHVSRIKERVSFVNCTFSTDMATTWATSKGLQVFINSIVAEFELCTFNVSTAGVLPHSSNTSVIDLSPGEAHIQDATFALSGWENVTANIWTISQNHTETIYACPKDALKNQHVTIMPGPPDIRPDDGCQEPPSKMNPLALHLISIVLVGVASTFTLICLLIIIAKRVSKARGSRCLNLGFPDTSEEDHRVDINRPLLPNTVKLCYFDIVRHEYQDRRWEEKLLLINRRYPLLQTMSIEDLQNRTPLYSSRLCHFYRATSSGCDVVVSCFRSVPHDSRSKGFRAKDVVIALSQCSHPNIVQLYGVVKEFPAIVMEYIKGNDLLALRRSTASISTLNALVLVQDIASALRHIHSRGIVHLEIQSKQILVQIRGENRRPIIHSFYNAILSSEENTDVNVRVPKESLRYCPPEILNAVPSADPPPRGFACDKVSSKADVYAFGLLLYEFWSGREAFQSFDTTTLQQIVREHGRPLVDDATFADCIWKDLMLSCWHQDPRQRPTMESVCTELQSLNKDKDTKTLLPLLHLDDSRRAFNE